MALIDDVKALCDRLAPRGWRELLRDVSDDQLDIAVPKAQLEAMLTKPLGTIRRGRPGFQEFASNGMRAVEPGRPGLSLLYHALACADVRPLRNGSPSTDPQDYPTLKELDDLENFIYSRAKRTLASFQNPVIAVFAYQYRPKALSVHRKHADLAFSRTGVARIGTEEARYDPILRSFESRPGGNRGFRVLPARYAAFIAEARSPGPQDAVLRPVSEIDSMLTFHFPVHKLFPGNECLWNADGTPREVTDLKFHEYHINEKLRRLHTNRDGDNPGFVKPLPIFNTDKPPFVRDYRNSQDLVKMESIGASVSVVSVAAPLVRTATQQVNNKNELVRFVVPRANENNRFATSLQLTFSGGIGRPAPEYANIRQEVVKKPNGEFDLVDLNQTKINPAAPEKPFAKKLADGGYEAADFIDQSCDGALAVQVSGLSLSSLCAFSLVTAVDFFPQVEQVEIQEWMERTFGIPLGLSWDSPETVLPHFRQGGPKSLNDVSLQ